MRKLKSAFQGTFTTKKRGGSFFGGSFEKIDKMYNQIPRDLCEEWKTYYAQYEFGSVPQTYPLSTQEVDKIYAEDDYVQRLFNDFQQIISYLNGMLSQLNIKSLEGQYLKEFVLFPFSKSEQNFIKSLMRITGSFSVRDLNKLKKGKWEIVPLIQRQEILEHISYLENCPDILNKYIRARDASHFREAINSLHLMLNNPILHRIKNHLDDAQAYLDDFRDIPLEGQEEIFLSLERAALKVQRKALEINKKEFSASEV